MKTIIQVLFLCFCFILINKIEVKAAQVDATDKTVFNELALIPNSPIDQSQKLQQIIKKTASNGDVLFIPNGTYHINQDIAITSNTKLMGTKDGSTVLKNDTSTPIYFQDSKYNATNSISFQSLYFDGINIFARLSDHLTLDRNIFYNLSTKFPIDLYVCNHAQIKNNIFMRDYTHSQPEEFYNRMIYMGGYSTSSRYQYMEDVHVEDNLFGIKIDELDAIKSFSRPSVNDVIDQLKKSIMNEEITISGGNEQNYFSTGINSYSMLKNATIRNNLFYQSYDNTDTHGVTGDHATYLRGAQDILLLSNHLRGLENGPAGGFKFKSGRNITIMNNYLRNTGIIMYGTAEYGLGNSYEEGPISELSSWFVYNNIFDFKYWQEKYAIGMEYNQHTGNDDVKNGVFMENQFINYDNIPANRRRGLLIANNTGGFRGENTFASLNTRDDGEVHPLLPEMWTEEDFAHQILNWRALISNEQINQYNMHQTSPIPIQDILVPSSP